MSFPATIAPATLETVIGGLALLFLTGAGGDMIAAHFAASQMLAAYHAETPDELGLAAEIVSLQLHTLQALSYASDRELSLNKILRLRGGAVSLSRESHKARRKLDQLQGARRAGVAVQLAEVAPDAVQPQPAPAKPGIDDAFGLIEAAREVIQTVQKTGGKNWSQSLQKRMTAKRIVENLRKKQAEPVGTAAHLGSTAVEQPPDQAGTTEAQRSSPPAPTQPRPPFTLSRQQRRAVERAVVKSQRKQAEQDRRKAMRTIITPIAASPTIATRQEARNQPSAL
jgi:hypothetical protein